jgi:hypothetical protein
MQSEESDETLYKKAHDKYYFIDNKQPLFPTEISKGAIYFIRNPLDVLVSFAYHSAKPVSKMIPSLSNKNYAFCDSNKKLSNQLRQLLGSWSDHVKSWTDQTEIPVHVMRYEDMIQNTFEYFKKAIEFIGIEKSDQEIKIALKKSDFSILSSQEKNDGFKEKMIKSQKFFRKGQIGDWRNHLSEQEAQEIVNNHRDMMLKFGYVDNKNQLLV